MKKFLLVALFGLGASAASAQTPVQDYRHYLGLQPSFLLEPYDTINALEVNIIPFAYEYRFSEQWGVQLRPIANYRFYEFGPGISQVGAGLFVNRYLLSLFEDVEWLVPSAGAFSTYTYNRLDLIHTLTLGAEVGAMFVFGENFTLNVNLQPGINYYPTQFSRDFVGSPSGWLSHFGVIVHFGYHLGSRG